MILKCIIVDDDIMALAVAGIGVDSHFLVPVSRSVMTCLDLGTTCNYSPVAVYHRPLQYCSSLLSSTSGYKYSYQLPGASHIFKTKSHISKHLFYYCLKTMLRNMNRNKRFHFPPIKLYKGSVDF